MVRGLPKAKAGGSLCSANANGPRAGAWGGSQAFRFRRAWGGAIIAAFSLCVGFSASGGPRYLRMIAVRSLEQAEHVRAEFRSGRPVEDLAREYSIDPSAERGGYLGFVSLDRLNARFKQAASVLKPGELGAPFESGLDWVLLYRMKRDFQASVATLQEQGDRALDEGNLQQALESYRQAVWIYPDYSQGYFSLGVVHGLMDQPDAEKEDYRRAILLAPDFVQAHYNLGKVYAAEGDPYSAIREFEKAIEIKPDHAEAHVNLSAIQLALGERQAALESARRAVEVNPLLASGHYNLGLARAASDLEGALDSFRLAATLNPNQLDARVNAAVALARLGRIAEARQDLKELLRTNPGLEPAQQLLQRIDQFEPELPNSNPPPGPPAISPSGPEAAAAETDGRRLLLQGKFHDASDLIENTLQRLPESESLRLLAAQARTAQGSLLYAQGRFDSAAREWRKALDWTPDFQPALLSLAAAATRRGAFSQAEEFIARAAEQQPNSPAVILARSKLEYERRDFFLAYGLLNKLQPKDLQPPQLLELVSQLLDLELQDKALQIAYGADLHTEHELQLSHLLTENALYAEAETLLQQHDSTAARLQMAHVYLRQLRFERAEPILESLLHTGYAPWQTRMLLGKLHIDAGEAGQAIKLLEEAVEIQPDNVNGIYQLALACSQTGKTDAAVGWLRRGLELETNSDRLLFELGRILVDQGNAAEALPHLLKLIQHQPDHPRAHYVLGSLYRQLGDLAASQRHLERFQALKTSLEADRRQLKARKAALKGPEQNG